MDNNGPELTMWSIVLYLNNVYLLQTSNNAFLSVESTFSYINYGTEDDIHVFGQNGALTLIFLIPLCDK